jgi:GTP-binding protein
VHGELAAFQPELARRARVIVLSKTDLADRGSVAAVRAAIEASAQDVTGDLETPVCAVSSVSGEGIQELTEAIAVLLSPVAAAEEAAAAPVVLRPRGERATDFVIAREGAAWRVSGTVLERLVAKADLTNDEAVAYLQQVMERAGVSAALRRAGAAPGDTVVVGLQEFDFS